MGNDIQGLREKYFAMNTADAYNSWASQYDTNINKTRDIEASALHDTLSGISFENCLEIGCGTGKNTSWLLTKAKHITAVDFSQEMLAKAKEKIKDARVEFVQTDILSSWPFEKKHYDLASFSLILEHIENLVPVFQQTAESLRDGGYLYVGELHPLKQYAGSKARFETENGLQVVTCFNHHITDFTSAATESGLSLVKINEYFDDNDRSQIPRLLTLLFRK